MANENQVFSFIRPPSTFGQVLSVGLSEPKEGDFGTYQRIVIEVDTPDEAEPFTIMLPMPKGWPNRINDRSTLARWFNRAAANDEGFAKLWADAKTVEEAMKRLEQKFVEFAREEYDFGGDRKFEYQTPKRLFADRNEMLKAYAETMGEEGGGAGGFGDAMPTSGGDIPADVVENARTTWEALKSAFSETEAEAQFKAMAWPVDVDKLLKAVKR